MIALLFFLSGGKYPLYDRYAQIALAAYKHDIRPRTPIVEAVAEVSMPAKSDKKGFSSLLGKTGAYTRYIESLENIFGTEYRKNRDIDRALRVYGHYMAAAEKLHVR